MQQKNTTYEDVKKSSGLSDWELTDIYNSYFGSRFSSPLGDGAVPGLLDALAEEKERREKANGNTRSRS